MEIRKMATTQFSEWWQKFKTTGDICPVRRGIARDELKPLLGPPDTTGGIFGKAKVPLIWKYGNLEFHFGPKNTDGLNCIYQDDQDGVPSIVIKIHQ